MKFSIMFFASDEGALGQDKYRLILESARYVDAHGFEAVWVPERHFAPLGSLFPNPAVLHAALARETQNVRLRAGSVVLPLHDPIRIAEEWSMVDNLSGGRVGISFASGWNPNDFAFFPGRYADRRSSLFGGIEKVQKLWRGDHVTVTNGVGQEVDVKIYPAPVQPELPLWVTAAATPKTFAQAGAMGANLLTHLLDQEPAQLAERVQSYRNARAEHGHDPDAGQVTVMLHTYLGASLQQATDDAREPYCNFLKSNIGLLKGLAASRAQTVDLAALTEQELDDFVGFLFDRFVDRRAMIGTGESCFKLVEELYASGVDEVACLLDFGPPVDRVLESLPRLAQLKQRASEELTGRAPAPLAIVRSQTAEVGELDGNSIEAARSRCNRELDGEAFYDQVAAAGASYGVMMRSIERLWVGDGECVGQLQLPGVLESETSLYRIHPAILDSCFLLIGALAFKRADGTPCIGLPVGMQRYRVHSSPGPRVWAHLKLLADEIVSGTPAADVRVFDQDGRLVAEAWGLTIQTMEVSSQDSATVDNLVYCVDWRQIDNLALAAWPQQRGSWLLLGDRTGIAQALAESLAGCGERVYVAEPGDSFAQLEAGRYLVDPASQTDIARLIAEITEQDAPLMGIVHLLALDTRGPDQTDVDTLRNEQRIGCIPLLHLVHTLQGRQNEQPPRVWVVTRGAQPAGDVSSISIAQAPLWGFGRVVSAEHGDLWGGLIDLDPDASPSDCASRLLPILVGSPEDQLALRGDTTFAPRLVRHSIPDRMKSASVRPDASYLIVGGMGDLGLRVAQWLVARGARYLILLGRTPLPARAEWDQAEGILAERIAAIVELERRGARVYTNAVDTADQARLERLRSELEQQGYPPIAGAVHTAAVVDGATLLTMTHDALDTVLTPKLTGLTLLRALSDVELDFFVLFSAIPALVGSIGAGAANYAAANAFLDALAHHSRLEGVPGLSMGYGPWNQIGLAVRNQAIELLARVGIGSMTPEQGIEALERALRGDETHIAVASIDWRRFFSAHGLASQSPFLSILVDEANDARADASSSQEVLRAIEQASPSARKSLLCQYIGQQVCRVLAMKPAKLDTHQSLLRMGIDSLMSIDLRNRIESDLGVVIPMVQLLKGPSVMNLVEQILPNLPEYGSIDEEEFDEFVL